MNRQLAGKLIHIEDVLPYLLADSYLPKRSAAKYLGMSPRKLEGLQEIERYRVGGMLYYKRSTLDRFMATHAEVREAKPKSTGGIRDLLKAAKQRALAEEKNSFFAQNG